MDTVRFGTALGDARRRRLSSGDLNTNANLKQTGTSTSTVNAVEQTDGLPSRHRGTLKQKVWNRAMLLDEPFLSA
jgi:hypothetical protein